MKRLIEWLLPALLAFTMASPAMAALSVFVCEPEWGGLVNEIAGSRATVFSATTAMQNPHLVQARPSLVAHARVADLLVCSTRRSAICR
jgi:zinc/manganese transport system substrate-binding protein